MKILLHLGLFLYLVFLAPLLTGCALTSSHVQKGAEHSETPFVVITEVEEPVSDILLDSTTATGATIDQILAESEYYCAEGFYADADSLLKEVVKLVGTSESEWLQDSIYVDAIIKIYSEHMPSEFSIPEEISIMVFQRQMYRSLDSIKFSPNDSAELAKLICRKDIVYEIPVVWNDRVQRALHYYLKSNKETMNRWLSRANFYLPYMKKVFADSGLPADLAYLPLIESGFNPKAYSHAHASGIWQFIASTGKIYGLRSNYWFDERRDPIKATVAATRYLKKLHNDFGDWHLALAAYNCGEGGLGRAIARCSTSNYWDLKLHPETMKYLPLYLAALTIAKNPDCFGYTPNSPDSFSTSFDTVHVSDCLDMKDIAQGIGVELDTLKKMNPHILHWCTPPDMSDVLLYLPTGTTQAFKQFYDEFPDEKKVKWFRYKIRRGDNLGAIARKFGIPIAPIRSVNRLKNNRIVAGKYLFIPIPSSGNAKALAGVDLENKSVVTQRQPKVTQRENIRYKVKQGDTVWRLSELFNVSPEEICRLNDLSEGSQIRAGQVLTISRNSSTEKPDNFHSESDRYMVQRGDTPASIARKFDISIDKLVELNNLNKKSPVIYAGELLNVSPISNAPVKREAARNTNQSGQHIKYVISIGDNLYRIAQNFSVPLESILDMNSINRNSVLRAGDTLLIPRMNQKKEEQCSEQVVFYKIKQGDNLWSIANSFGISVEQIYKCNNLHADSILMPGKVIKVIKTDKN